MAKTRSMIEMIRGASEDVQKTTTQVVQAMRDDQAMQTSPDYGEKVAQAIQHYAQMTSEFIRAIGEQMITTAQSYAAESSALADNISRCAELEAERCKDFIYRMREGGLAMKAAKQQFEKAVGHRIDGGDIDGGDIDGKTEVDIKALEQVVAGK